MTTALEGGEWWAARPGRTLPPGKTRYPFHRRLGGPQGRSGRAENRVPTGIRSRTVQPVVSRYTDWATGPTVVQGLCYKSEGHWLRYGPGVDSASNRNEYQVYFLGLKAAVSYHHPVPLLRNLGTLTSWIPLGHSGPVTGLLYILTFTLLPSAEKLMYTLSG